MEAVVSSDLGVVSKKKRSEAPEVATSTMPAPSKGESVEQGEGK